MIIGVSGGEIEVEVSVTIFISVALSDDVLQGGLSPATI